MDHERFKELAALAAGGLLSGPEDMELRSHLEVCAPCRHDLAEYEDMLFNQFPLVGSSTGSLPNAKNGRHHKTRFIARARTEGINLSDEAEAANGPWTRVRQLLPPLPVLGYGATAVLAILCSLLGVRLRAVQERELAYTKEIRALQDQSVALQGANTGLEKRLEDLSKDNGVTEEAERRLSGAKEQYSLLAARYVALERELKTATEHAAALSAEREVRNGREQSLSAKVKETEASLAAMGDELESLRKTQTTAGAVLNEKLSQVKELEAQLAGMNDSMDRVKK